MSFVDMMANDVWTPTDIDTKVHAMIRSRYSSNDELKAARLSRSGADPDFVAAVDAWIATCIDEGRAAQDDMSTLLQVRAVETAERRLAQPEVLVESDEMDEVLNQTEVDQDQSEREAAQAVLDSASQPVMQWVELRRPAPIVEEDIPTPLFIPVTEDAESAQ